jgi:hypothetical protein
MMSQRENLVEAAAAGVGRLRPAEGRGLRRAGKEVRRLSQEELRFGALPRSGFVQPGLPLLLR